MNKLDMIYEGKAKKVFRTDDPKQYVVSYKDDATAFNGLKKGSIADKGIVNNKMHYIPLNEAVKKKQRISEEWLRIVKILAT